MPEAAVSMFYEIGILKSFAILIGKYLSWSLFLLKLQTSKICKIIKKRLQHKVFYFEYCGIFKDSFFYSKYMAIN